MYRNYQRLSDPPFDWILLPVSGTVDIKVGGFVGREFTDLASAAGDATKISSAASPFTSADVGRILVITDGTNWTVQAVVITAVDGNGLATLSASAGGTGLTGGAGYQATDCRGLLILGTGNVVCSSARRPTTYATLPSVPVGMIPGRFGTVRNATNSTTATNIFALY